MSIKLAGSRISQFLHTMVCACASVTAAAQFFVLEAALSCSDMLFRIQDRVMLLMWCVDNLGPRCQFPCFCRESRGRTSGYLIMSAWPWAGSEQTLERRGAVVWSLDGQNVQQVTSDPFSLDFIWSLKPVNWGSCNLFLFSLATSSSNTPQLLSNSL